MSKTLLSRLAMFETIDACGPLTITELARRTGHDVTVVSRTVSACEPDGWLIRINGKVALGPRCTLLGHSGPIADVIAAAAPLVHSIAGVTGFDAHAYGLAGAQSVLIAAAAGRGPGLPPGLGVKAPLYATAGGRAIAIQLDSDHLDPLLPSEPFPDAVRLIADMAGMSAAPLFSPLDASRRSGDRVQMARSRAELADLLDTVRAEGMATDNGALDPTIHCIAVPWPQPALPAALVCLGPAHLIASNTELIARTLTAAARPGATPDDVLTAGAQAITKT